MFSLEILRMSPLSLFVYYPLVKALVYPNMLISMALACEYMWCELRVWLKWVCFECEQKKVWGRKRKKKVEKGRKRKNKARRGKFGLVAFLPLASMFLGVFYIVH